MKKIIFVFAILLLNVSLYAQFEEASLDPATESRIEAQRVAYITNQLELTPEESQKFWPVFNQLKSEIKELKKSNRKSKKDINLDSLSDQEIEELLNAQFDFEIKEIELKRSYFQKFKTILPIKKVAKLAMVDRAFKKEIFKRFREERKGRRH